MNFRIIKLISNTCLLCGLIILLSKCKRENSEDCMADVQTIGELTNAKGIIRLVDTPSNYGIFIAPQGMDTQRYVPCNLPESFEIPNEEVVVSALVKYTLDPYFSGDYQPLVITKIGKQD